MSARSWGLWLLMLVMWLLWLVSWPARALWAYLRRLWAQANGDIIDDDWNGEDDWR